MQAKAFRRPRLSGNAFLMVAVALIVVTCNASFWSLAAQAISPTGSGRLLAFAAIGTLLGTLVLMFLAPLSWRGLLKPAAIFVLMICAAAAYFMDGFGAVIDRHALASVMETDAREAAEWLSPGMLLRIGLLGLVPAALLAWVRIEWKPFWPELFSRIKLLLACCALAGLAVAVQGRQIASFVRNHDQVKHLANPYAIVAATLSYIDHARNDGKPIQPIGEDAHRRSAPPAGAKPALIVLAIGESARTADFALGGYARDTNPELAKLPVVYFGNVKSCGTNTATSLPCMFSDLGRASYDDAKVRQRQNLLDVLARGGFDLLWLDNNTGSKRIAIRTREEDYQHATDPRFCHGDGCWDAILLDALQRHLPRIQRDTVIVVHLLGSHGPAYYQRYPPQFARFTPECRDVQLSNCSRDAIRNSYDNTILYTDHILAQIVDTLQRDANRLDSVMLFVSDHGESTGEHGLYLHGAPYPLAPDEQTRVPMLLWAAPAFAQRNGLDLACLQNARNRALSHDNFFHISLGMGDVESTVYLPELDAFSECRKPPEMA